MWRLLYWRARTRTLQTCSLTRAGEPRLFHAFGLLCKKLFSDQMCYDFQCDCNGNQTKEKWKSMHRVLSRIYRLGNRSPECPWGPSFLAGSGGTPPPPPPAPSRFLQMNVRWDAIWCILRHDFAKCYSGILFHFLVVITFWQCHNTLCSLSYSVLRQGILHVHSPRRVWIIFPL